jgi:ribosomal protein S18 acetylase RimI-like enzyme
MPSHHSVTRIDPARDPAVIDALANMLCRAFDKDAHINWIVRQDSKRSAAFRNFFQLLLTDLLGNRGELYATSDRQAAAVWFPPQTPSLSLLSQARVGIRFAAITGWQNLPIRAYGLNQMETRHPKIPHYFLQTIGVDPDVQGHGHGSALLEVVLQRCDAEGLATYLETSNEANISFYEKHGFHVIDTAQLPKGPILWQMQRSR